MRGPVISRALSAAIVGVVVLLAVGGGYAVASSGSKKITACVQRHGGGLYTGKCKTHDKKLTWNTTGPAGAIGRSGPTGPTGPTGAAGQTGPQGPGATTFVYNTTGVAAPSTLGTAGPYSLSADCSQPVANETRVDLLETGPATTLDGFDLLSTGAEHALNVQYPAQSSAAQLAAADSTSTTPAVSFYNLLFLPTGGSAPVEMQITLSAVGGTTNTCHLSVVVTPTS